jgi:hypothetical protein
LRGGRREEGGWEDDAQHNQQHGRRWWTRGNDVVGPADAHCRHCHQRGGTGADTGPNRGRGCDGTCDAVVDTEGEGTSDSADATAREDERGDRNATGGVRGVEDNSRGRGETASTTTATSRE